MTTPEETPARWVATDNELRDLVDRLRGLERYAIDTEFHRERTYFPQLALVQLTDGHDIALVDPLSADPRLLGPLFESPALAVVHAAQQDLDVLQHAVGVIPSRIYDTQLAANFAGYTTPSLSVLLQGELKISPPKGDRLTDWLRRPLSAAQREYAATDVLHLFELHDRLAAKLAASGRTAWAEEACEELRTRPVGQLDPDDAWMKLKDARALKPRGRAVAQAVAAWREREARSIDIPVRQVLPDLAVLGIAQRQPTTLEELLQCRGVDDRHRRGRIGSELLAAVQRGREAPPPATTPGGDDVERSLRPAITLISAWISQVAKDAHLDTSMLATRNDLVALVAGDERARLRQGWRAELIGDGVARLVSGQAGLTFDGNGGLQLIDVASAQ